MQKTKLLLFILVVSAVLITACADNASVVESESYKNEEIEAYNNIVNDIVDSTHYSVKGKTAVFFLFDTLSELDNRPTPDYEVEEEYLEERLEKRKIKIEKLSKINNYKFIRATKYPKDSLVDNTTMYTIIQDTIRLKENEYFTSRWVTFSRICFDKDYKKGYLYFKSWCGNLCSSYDRLDIEKVDGKWRLRKRRNIYVS